MKWLFWKRDREYGNIFMRGSNNRIIIVESGVERPIHPKERIQGLNIFIVGNNNTVKIERPFNAHKSLIIIKNNDVNVELGRTAYFLNANIKCTHGNAQVCKIGRDTTINGAQIELCENSGLIIGDDCLLASDIKIWGSDAHSILDKDTLEILNFSDGPITIGNHVWIGESVILTKKTRIKDDCVVAAGTICCHDYQESNVVIAGNPGKIIRRNIIWDKYNPQALNRRIS